MAENSVTENHKDHPSLSTKPEAKQSEIRKAEVKRPSFSWNWQSILTIIFGVITIASFVSLFIPPRRITVSCTPYMGQFSQIVLRQYDITDIEKQFYNSGIDNYLLSRLYEQAYEKAKHTYTDSALQYFSVVVTPYDPRLLFTIYYDFYCADSLKILSYCSYDGGIIRENLYSRIWPAQKNDKPSYSGLPWSAFPEWSQLLGKGLRKIEPMSPTQDTYYTIYCDNNERWHIYFYDGLTGNVEKFYWDGEDIQIEN